MSLTIRTNEANTEGADRRLGELMLFVAKRCENDPTFGATKLNKILFFADFSSFLKTGKSVTGAVYMRQDKGPVPRRLVPAREELLDQRRAVVQQNQLWNGMVQNRLIALDQANLTVFSKDELQQVDAVIENLHGKTAAEVSQLSHEECLAWEIAEDGEDIPYEAAFLLPIRECEGAAVRAAQLAQTQE
jgi:hypothetical protein